MQEVLDFVVVDTYNHHIPTGLGFLEGLRYLGHNAYSLINPPHNINQIDQKVDCLVILGWPDPEEVINFKQTYPDTKIVVVMFGWNDVVLQLKDYVDVWMEHTYKHDLADEMFYRHGLKLHHIPLGASIDRFKPLNIKKEYDLSFVGQFGERGHGYRHEDVYLYPLMNLNSKGFYSGFEKYPNVQHTQLNEIYNTTKININFHYAYQKQQTSNITDCIDFNGRVFEIALAGGFQLCDHPYIQQYFGEGIACSSAESWTDTFNYYLNNPDSRNDLSLKAQQTALKNHTWKARMQQLIDTIYKK